MNLYNTEDYRDYVTYLSAFRRTLEQRTDFSMFCFAVGEGDLPNLG